MQGNTTVMMGNRVTRNVLVRALRSGVIGIIGFMDVEHFTCMRGAITIRVGNCRHGNDAEKQPDQNQQ